MGAPKIFIELAEALEELGWNCKIASPSEIMPLGSHKRRFCVKLFAESLRKYLLKYGSEYNVVEYDHIYLPYPREEFYPKTLFVSRVGLLEDHFQNNSIPLTKSFKTRIRSLIMARIDKFHLQRIKQYSRITLNESDIINTFNYNYKSELTKLGISPEKIVVFPCGISRSRKPFFDAISSEVPGEPKIVFIGSFDNRKGAMDFPAIFENIHKRIPEVRFRLLGTGGNVRDILIRFPKYLRSCIEVIPSFPSEDLPSLLSSCSVGIFPSYADGFGFGVLEMLAASLPVIAYNVFGPAMMLPSKYLISVGNVEDMSLKAVELLQDKARLKTARIWAKERAKQFFWPEIARQTSQIYLEHWQRKQGNSLKMVNEYEDSNGLSY